MKTQYDFAVSLGGTCTAAESLRRAGMQFASFPFDWAGGEDVRVHAEIIADDFRRFLPFEQLEYRGSNDEKNGDIYVNRENGSGFYHDFPYETPLAESYPAIKAKYDRRIARFIERMEKGGRVLAMFVQAPGKPISSDADLLRARELISGRYPKVELDLFYVYLVQKKPFAREDVVEVGEHVFKVGFDIAMPGFYDARVADRKAIIPMLKTLFPQGAVDYRTDEERRAHKQAMQQKKYQVMHASTWVEYMINRFNWLMFRHFRNRLEKLGFENLPSHRAT